MPLESLSNEQINIHDLTLEQEKKSVPEWQKRYEVLKETSLFSVEPDFFEYGLWLHKMEDKTEFRSRDQLLAILVERKFDPELAKQHYEGIQNTNLYNEEGKRWNLSGRDQRRFSEPQLIAVSIEAGFDLEKAKAHFQSLHNNKNYYENGHWVCDFNNDLFSGNALQGILTESIFNLPAAEKNYQRLKKSLYNEKENFWRLSFTSEAKYADTELKAVLALAKFDLKKAKERFNFLKTSPFYDPDTKMWLHYKRGSFSDETEIRSEEQLLGILCEEVITGPVGPLSTIIPPLPETRSY